MDDKKLISVIIPAYNVAYYLPQCLENIKYQTYKNIEVIVVDDGSTDDTAKIASQYNVKLIRQQNQGVSAARNTGIRNSSGEYLHFMDPDDLISLNFYEEMLKTILSCDAEISYCDVINERDFGQSVFISNKFLVINIEDKLKMTNVNEDHFCFKYLFNASFLKREKLEFDETINMGEDLVFSLQAIFLCNKLISSPEAVYIYKKRDGSAMGNLYKRNKRIRKELQQPIELFKESFRKKHNLDPFPVSYKWVYYRFLGFRIFKKKVQQSGSEKWYLFGICIVQKKA